MDYDRFIVVSQSILDHTVTIDPSKRDVILCTSTIQQVRKESALADIMNPDVSVMTEYNSLFEMDYNGTIFADFLYPQMVWKDALSFIYIYAVHPPCVRL